MKRQVLEFGDGIADPLEILQVEIALADLVRGDAGALRQNARGQLFR